MAVEPVDPYVAASGSRTVKQLPSPRALLLPRTGAAAVSQINAPLAPVDGAHTLLVVAVYAAVFTATAFLLTWRRDVLE